MRRIAFTALIVASVAALAQAAAIAPIDAAGLKTELGKHKGKVVVVNLWASWCVPCKQEFPELVAITGKNKSKGVDLVTIACDDKATAETTSLKFLTAQKATAGAFYNAAGTDHSGFLKALEPSVKGGSDANPIPRTYLFSKSGKLVKTLVGKQTGAAFQAAIDAALAAK